jgi:hypothetical protein
MLLLSYTAYLIPVDLNHGNDVHSSKP